MFKKRTAWCPVCPKPEGAIGYITPGEVCIFLCNDCKFFYTWNQRGILQPPVKYHSNKKDAQCGCGGCRYRDTKVKHEE